MDQRTDGKPVGWIIPKTINLSPPFLFLKLDSGFANGTLGVKKKLTLLLFHLLEMIKKSGGYSTFASYMS